MMYDIAGQERMWMNTPPVPEVEGEDTKEAFCRTDMLLLDRCSGIFSCRREGKMVVPKNDHKLKKPLSTFAGDLLSALSPHLSIALPSPPLSPVPDVHTNVYRPLMCLGRGKRNVYGEQKMSSPLNEKKRSADEISDSDDRASKRRRFDMSSLLDVVPSASPLNAGPAPFCENTARSLFLTYHYLCPKVQGNLPKEDLNTEYISGDGLLALENDLGWHEYGNAGVTAFFFLLSTKYVHLISYDEWLYFFECLRVGTIEEARHRCLYLHRELIADKAMHTQYFCHSFKFFSKARQRVIDKSLAQKLLATVVGPMSTFSSSFCEYLDAAEIRWINFDQWRNFLPFSQEIDPLCSNYSEKDAWPTLYDDYVRWLCTNRELGGNKRRRAVVSSICTT
ncbi:hypothetical protein DIPPA_70177 [Diplonema papillatum]|nr:hypothetical protein DIPPA_70177 [Diplonema papillatum]